MLSNAEVMPGVHLLWAHAPEIATLAQPGQFVMVRCSEGYDPLLRRPLSLHRVAPLSSPSQLALLFTVVGSGTRWLAQREEGDTLDLLGPLGRGFVLSPQYRDLLLVAGGIGIAPLIFLAEQCAADGLRPTLVVGAPTQEQLYPTALLPSGLRVLSATEDGSVGMRGVATDVLPELVDGADQIFACGPLSMYHAMAGLDWLNGKSVQVSLEARMGCGFGVCYGCALETKAGVRLVCHDGPVFELKDIVW